MSTTLSEYLDNTLEKCGSFGRFQLVVVGSLFLGEISVAWSILMMTFGGAIPDWYCEWGNSSTDIMTYNFTHQIKSCNPPANHSHLFCIRKVFDPALRTIVEEVILNRYSR